MISSSILSNISNLMFFTLAIYWKLKILPSVLLTIYNKGVKPKRFCLFICN